ncbi:cytochrome c-type biogenesis protein [Serratia microhaemolytica]|uniref:cytochrome c-type biogenesis protein n=1 Tax=Serratia microhaemolytica TaxID=2675110 RepID=UPI000FDD7350|nr:cytochrome c-type biogenesis protein [Serratia microhaemolytica]
MRLCALLLALLLTSHASAVIESYVFDSPEQQQLYRELTLQLRCPKCQNNNIADSNAIIAADMRNKVYELLNQGNSKQEVINYMVARYGNFVTYQPPVTAATLILWIGPLLFVVLGGTLILRRTARRGSVPQQQGLSAQEQQRLTELLTDNDRNTH